jgi:hypothetical protein
MTWKVTKKRNPVLSVFSLAEDLHRRPSLLDSISCVNSMSWDVAERLDETCYEKFMEARILGASEKKRKQRDFSFCQFENQVKNIVLTASGLPKSIIFS